MDIDFPNAARPRDQSRDIGNLTATYEHVQVIPGPPDHDLQG